MPETTARVAASPTADAPACVCRPAQAADAGDQDREHERLDEAGEEVGQADGAVGLAEEREERDAERLHRHGAAEQSKHIREQREQRRHQQRGEDARRDEEADRVESHRRQRVDLLVDAHRADLRGERSPRSPGEQDRRHQRTELAQHREPDQVGDEDLGAEALHRDRGLEREDHAEQERDERDDRQAVGARPLGDAPDVAPADGVRMRERVGERSGGFADERDLRASCRATRCAAARPTSSMTRWRGGSGSRSCSRTSGSNSSISASYGGRRLRISIVRRARTAQQLHEQRRARTVAIVDTRRIDDHRSRRRIGDSPVDRAP